jgi:DNA-binding CsgD family transcriptional regulator
MARNGLTAKELYRLSASAVELYAAPDRNSLAHKIATLISNALSVEHSGMWQIDLGTLEQSCAYANAASVEIANRSWPVYSHYAAHYPIFREEMLTPKNNGRLVRASDILPHSVVEPIGFIDEYARPNFCEFQLLYFFKQHGSRLAFMNCSRNGRNYSEKEIAILEFLAPHFQAAYENSNAFEAREEALKRTRAIQDTLSVESIWVNDNFKVQESTARIPQLIREFFQQEFTSQQLPQKILVWLRASIGQPLTPLVIRRADASLTIRLYPRQLPGLNLLTLTRRVTVPTVEHLKPLGLTRRESEILLWVAQAKTNDEIGIILGISGLTVKKHVEHISSKLGVNSRVALATIPFSDI